MPKKLRSQVIRLAYKKPELQKHLVPLIVSKTSARPLPLDRGALRKISEKIIELGMRKLRDKEEHDLLGRHKTLAHLKVDPKDMPVRDVMEMDIELQIQLKTDRSPVDPSQIVWGGAGTYKGRKDSWAIVLYVSEGLSINIFKRYLQDQLYQTLAHEMTHILDKKDEGGISRYEEDGILDYEAYVNDPSEVRAFMREITEQAYDKYQKLIRVFDKKKALRNSIKTDTWHKIENQLTPENRKLILKGALRGLQELIEEES